MTTVKDAIIECLDELYLEYKKEDGFYGIPNATEEEVYANILDLVNGREITSELNLYIVIVQYNSNVHIKI